MGRLSNDFLAGRKQGWAEVIKELQARWHVALKKHDAFVNKYPESDGLDKWKRMADALDELIPELGAKAATLPQPIIELPEPSAPAQDTTVNRIISAAIMTTVAFRLKDEGALVECLRRLSGSVSDYEWSQREEGEK